MSALKAGQLRTWNSNILRYTSDSELPGVIFLLLGPFSPGSKSWSYLNTATGFQTWAWVSMITECSDPVEAP